MGQSHGGMGGVIINVASMAGTAWLVQTVDESLVCDYSNEIYCAERFYMCYYL